MKDSAASGSGVDACRHASSRATMSDRASPDLAAPATADDAGPRTYAGGKNGPGIFQRIISQMPPHEHYIEPFLGSGAVMRRKKPAPGSNIGIDVDAGVIAAHGDSGHDCTIVEADALAWLEGWASSFNKDVLIYCDPPYLGAARHWPARDIYRHEMKGEAEHAELLRILTTCPAMVMISGYPSALYDSALAKWRRLEYQAQTRGGLKTEVLWMNFPEPTELHDYRWLGTDFHDRCRIGRKINRWVSRLRRMPALERAAVMEALCSPERHLPPLVPCASTSAIGDVS